MSPKLLLLGIIIMCLIGSQSVMFAQTIYVNSVTGNDATGNGSSGSPYKTFTKGYTMVSAGSTLDLTGTFTWTDADETEDVATTGYTIDKNITIQGQGADKTIIQAATSAGSASCRVFTVNGTYSITFSNLEIRYGYLNDYSDGGGLDLEGSATITITNCYIHHNTSRQGAGINIMNPSVSITNSTIANNSGTNIQTGVQGGGICQQGSSPLIITNTTICNNYIYGYGGGVCLNSFSTITITNCTIVNNTSEKDGGGISLENNSAILQIKNTIVANNTSTTVAAAADFDKFQGTLTDNGYNIVEVGTGTFTSTGDRTGDQPNLFGTGTSTTPSLALNGSINGTPTLALSSGSVAINAGNSTSNNSSVEIPTTDQRGLNRAGATDIGAYEFGAAAPTPTVTGISPTSGPTAGGTSVVITGTNLSGATSVMFGGNAATGVTVNSATQVTVTSPSGSANTVHVTVTTAGGTSATSSADQFTYVAAPTITGISPTSGPTAGGTSVVITGTNLLDATAVRFGSTSATGYTVNSATQITATSPALSVSTVDITVTTPGGTSATSASDQFTYVAAPTITSISPTSGPTAGSTSVVITGTNLLAATAVKFGSTNATGYTVNSATQITATSPATSASTVDITVTTAGGTSATSASDQFTYVAAPTITSITPTSGPTAGSTSVVITGTNLLAASAVKFGSNAGSITNNTATSITATSPAGSTGTVDIRVTTAGGTSATRSADQFTYVAAPTITSFTPSTGPVGTLVTITGTNLSSPSTFTIGGVTAIAVSNNGTSLVSMVMPGATTGTVVVTTAGGTATSASNFTVTPGTCPGMQQGSKLVGYRIFWCFPTRYFRFCICRWQYGNSGWTR